MLYYVNKKFLKKQKSTQKKFFLIIISVLSWYYYYLFKFSNILYSIRLILFLHLFLLIHGSIQF